MVFFFFFWWVFLGGFFNANPACHVFITLHRKELIGTVQGASKIKLKKRTVRVRRVIIFLNISRHPLLIWLRRCFHQYKTRKAVATAKAATVLLTPARNLNKVFWGFLVVFPLFNHFLGYVEIYQRVIWPTKIDFETFERL